MVVPQDDVSPLNAMQPCDECSVIDVHAKHFVGASCEAVFLVRYAHDGFPRIAISGSSLWIERRESASLLRVPMGGSATDS